MSLYKFTHFVKNDAQLKQKKSDKQPKKSQNKAKKILKKYEQCILK